MLKLALASLLLAFRAIPGHAEPVDVSIVFAVDASGSVDPPIAHLQKEGHALALEAPEVIAAIQRGYVGCIAIVYFEWSAKGAQRLVLPWSRVCDANAAAGAAQVIRDNGTSRGFGRRTSLTAAIEHSSWLLEGFDAPRKVIDICANGPNNDASNIVKARQGALRKGHVINAIVELDLSEPDLLRYFQNKIIGGKGSFVTSVNSPDDFAVALRSKLIKEISGDIATLTVR